MVANKYNFSTNKECSIITENQDSISLRQEEAKTQNNSTSAFQRRGFQATIEEYEREIQKLYQADYSPWIIGYSGGKDSTATLQLVWNAIAKLPNIDKQKKIYVISTNTLVENPIVANWVKQSLSAIQQSAQNQDLPFVTKQLTPNIKDTFWVNLLGRGYPAPRYKFRWCTDRLKIKPSNSFINSIVSYNGETILVLGTRKAESSNRSANMEKFAKERIRDKLSPNASLPGSYIYTPIEDWSNDDVWSFLMKTTNPWGNDNEDLLKMYEGATEDGECPLVVDDSTPSCGNSRFGCWVCTLVEKDKSMTAMIKNDSEKEWLQPLLDLRNAIDFRTDENDNFSEDGDRKLRDFRRMSGKIQLMPNGKEIPGPYLQEIREKWLGDLLRAQTYIQQNAPKEIQDIELITLEELREIRRIWVVDKHEIEDSLPQIYFEATGQTFPDKTMDDNSHLSSSDMQELKNVCGQDRMLYELSRDLLSLTFREKNKARRAGIFEKIEKTFEKYFFENKDEAIERAKQIDNERKYYHAQKKDHALRVTEDSREDSTHYDY